MTDIKVSMETCLQVNSTEFPHQVGLTMIPSTVVWCVTMLCQGLYRYIFSNLLYAPIAEIIIPFVLYMEYCTTHIQTFVGGPRASLYQ